jgi:hypothetical protein
MKKILLFIFLIVIVGCDRAPLIQDYKIEKIGLGDSLLDHFSKVEINNSFKFQYDYLTEKKFISLEISSLGNLNKYDAVQVEIKPNDLNYIIYAIDGILFMKDMNNCDKKLYEFNEIFSDQFINAKQIYMPKKKHPGDKSGRSISWGNIFYLDDDVTISVLCYDWHKDMGYADSLKIGIRSAEVNDWLRSKKL